MRQTVVGMRCPECAKVKTHVTGPAFLMGNEPRLTYALIAANVIMLPLTNLGLLNPGGGGGGLLGGGQLNHLGLHLALFGPAVHDGQYYRLITSAFIHFGIIHLAFNMYALYLIGGALERYVGSFRFGVIYLLSALAGAFGALLVTPNAITAGASGAIFGLMGALLVLERQRGVALLGGSIGGLLVINLIFTFGVSGISIGGHLGGLAGGVATGIVLSGYGRGHIAHGRLTAPVLLGLIGIGVASFAGSLAVAG
jgi:membrane associated rhomboid family serine protease